tara:strand:+ start:1965 stop:2120 length:156 start_codon:yes stop_codon:yes gene_type:complete
MKFTCACGIEHKTNAFFGYRCYGCGRVYQLDHEHGTAICTNEEDIKKIEKR